MRTTQFIGLTARGNAFVKDLEPVDDSSHKTQGLGHEDVPLKTWKMTGKYGRTTIVREVVQITMWSSGPMILTMLQLDYGNGATSDIFQWIVDPTTKHEIDYEAGSYWI